jgi:hypothetical protein
MELKEIALNYYRLPLLLIRSALLLTFIIGIDGITTGGNPGPTDIIEEVDEEVALFSPTSIESAILSLLTSEKV